MNRQRGQALAGERDISVDFLRTLTAAEWAAPSRCEGWTVKDVVAHMGAAAKGFFTPWVIGLIVNGDIEKHNDRDTEKRADWSPERVLTEYVRWSKPAGRLLRALQAPGLRAVPLRLAEAGVYRAELFASAICFDIGTHVRYDIATAIGRSGDLPPPSADAVQVSAEWMVHGIPAMSGDRLAWLDGPVELRLTGEGASTWTVEPGGRKGRVRIASGLHREPAAVIAGDAVSFPVWGTGRESWRDHGVNVVSGARDLGERFLETVRII